MSKSKKIVTGITDQLPLAIKTGKYLIGYKQTLKSLHFNKAKVIVLTRNYPASKRKLIEYYAMINKVAVLGYEGNNNELAKLVDKFYRCGVISIVDQGEADLINKAI